MVIRAGKTGADSSSRTWGCFFVDLRERRTACAFPTYVGVFLSVERRQLVRKRLPQARRGDSRTEPSRMIGPRAFMHAGFRCSSNAVPSGISRVTKK